MDHEGRSSKRRRIQTKQSKLHHFFKTPSQSTDKLLSQLSNPEPSYSYSQSIQKLNMIESHNPKHALYGSQSFQKEFSDLKPTSFNSANITISEQSPKEEEPCITINKYGMNHTQSRQTTLEYLKENPDLQLNETCSFDSANIFTLPCSEVFGNPLKLKPETSKLGARALSPKNVKSSNSSSYDKIDEPYQINDKLKLGVLTTNLQPNSSYSLDSANIFTLPCSEVFGNPLKLKPDTSKLETKDMSPKNLNGKITTDFLKTDLQPNSSLNSIDSANIFTLPCSEVFGNPVKLKQETQIDSDFETFPSFHNFKVDEASRFKTKDMSPKMVVLSTSCDEINEANENKDETTTDTLITDIKLHESCSINSANIFTLPCSEVFGNPLKLKPETSKLKTKDLSPNKANSSNSLSYDKRDDPNQNNDKLSTDVLTTDLQPNSSYSIDSANIFTLPCSEVFGNPLKLKPETSKLGPRDLSPKKVKSSRSLSCDKMDEPNQNNCKIITTVPTTDVQQNYSSPPSSYSIDSAKIFTLACSDVFGNPKREPETKPNNDLKPDTDFETFPSFHNFNEEDNDMHANETQVKNDYNDFSHKLCEMEHDSQEIEEIDSDDTLSYTLDTLTPMRGPNSIFMP